jgi:hypothetical protein
VPSASASAAVVEAVPAPKDVSSWTVGGVSISVADDRVIDRALAADLDSDGNLDAVAWTRPRSEPPDSHAGGELLFFGGKTPAGRVVATMPPYVPAGPGCRHTVGLSATGPHTVTLDVAAKCDAALVPRSPTRGVLVVAPADDEPTVLGLRLADPAPGDTLAVTVDSRDRDGDGQDDVRVALSLASEGNDTQGAFDLVWLDRAAGASRDTTEPLRSLSAAASLDVVRAHGKNTSREVTRHVENLRRLYGAACAESGASRLFDADGVPIPCGKLGPALDSLLVAEVRAAIARRDVLSAFAALDRDGWYGAPLAAKAHAALEKELFEAAPKREVTARTLEVSPRARAGLPRYSPLVFASETELLVETADGVVRVRLPAGQTEDASESEDAWPLTVGGAKEPRWTGIAFPCDRDEVVLLESDPAGTPLPSEPVRLLAPRPGPCGHGGVTPSPDLVPLEWTSSRRVGLIGGESFGASDPSELTGAPPKGSPRSPDGRSLVVATRSGLLVSTRGKAETWTVADPASLSDCIVADGARAVACTRADRVVVLTP